MEGFHGCTYTNARAIYSWKHVYLRRYIRVYSSSLYQWLEVRYGRVGLMGSVHIIPRSVLYPYPTTPTTPVISDCL